MNKKAKIILINLDFVITGIALIILIACTIWGVVRRYVLGAPIIWLEEVQMGCVVWVVFIGAGAVFRNGGHIAIEILVETLPKKVQKIITIFSAVFVGTLLIFLMVQGAALVRQMSSSYRMTSILRMPYSAIYSAMPVGCFLMLINMMTQTYLSLRTSDNKMINEKEGGRE